MSKITFPDFPKKIYVKVEDDNYLVASADPSDLTEQGVAVPAAEYVLAQAGVVIETKVVVTGGAAPVPTPLGASERPDVQPDKKPRKPRSDAGQPRGPYKTNGADAGTTASSTPGTTPEAGAGGGDPVTPECPPATPTAAAPAPTPPAAPTVPTLDDVKAAMSKLSKAVNIDANIKMLAKFGVDRASALPEAKRAEFIAAVLKAAGVA
jgi:hypothetical protein